MSGIMFLLGTYGGRFLNKLFPSYDSNKKNYVQSFEIIVQAGTTGALTYIMRELMISASISLFGPKAINFPNQLDMQQHFMHLDFYLPIWTQKKLQHLLPLNESGDNIQENTPIATEPAIVQKQMTNKDVINLRMEEQRQNKIITNFLELVWTTSLAVVEVQVVEIVSVIKMKDSLAAVEALVVEIALLMVTGVNLIMDMVKKTTLIMMNLKKGYSSCGRRNSNQDSRESFYSFFN